MRAGALDRRISILRSTPVDDGMQTTAGEFAAAFSRAASVEWVRDGEKFAAGETQASVAVRFQVRWDSDTATIDVRDRVAFEGRTFEVVGVKEIGRREGLEISASARAEAAA